MKGILVAALILVFTSAGCSLQSGDVTVYKLQCSGQVVNDRCDGKWMTLNPTTYTVFPEQQIVVFGSSFGVNRLSNCVVQNVKNWTCEYSDHSGQQGMINGQFSEIPNKDMSSDALLKMINNIRVVPWWKYAQVWLGEF